MDAGLCADCRHCQIVETARSRFYLCRRSFDDARYRKYPVLPVRACPGYERDNGPESDAPEEPPR